ncbi:MAG TPA: hypothetical protein VKU02_30660 [Gemmataceae bacterium]|jgi:hypothetical protein|nr:hypothetical protein [Gemmataceae bacterium]
MAVIGGTQFLERLQFFNGQRLFAGDLQALEAFNREMRWLHNQSLHQAGVGSGYAVSGAKGDREVIITPGYAIDACGREIVLTQSHVESVPPVADDGAGNSVFYDLTVSYPDDSDLPESETRDGICLPAGAVRLRETPNFCWIKLGADGQPVDPQLKLELQSSMRILLARAEIKNCQLNQPISTVQRRNARPAKQPHIACGRTDPATSAWTVWLTSDHTPLGLQLAVDTSSANFKTPPCYSAHVIGDRFFPGGTGELAAPSFVLDGWVNISNPTITGFTLLMLMPELEDSFINPANFFNNFTTSSPTGLAQLQANGWFAVWMGVES